MMTATSCIRLAVALAAAAASLTPGPARAQGAASRPPGPARAQSAAAESLFREGKRLMNNGDIAQACDKFEAADRVEATASTELNLGDCREKNGQLATAWVVFVNAEATAKHAGDTRRVPEAHRRATLLEPKLVYLTIAVPDEARVDGLVIKRNGTAVDTAVWNQRVPVDPDEYTISAEAPGYRPWNTTVVVQTKSKKVKVPPLDKRPAEPRREVRSAATEPDAPAGGRDREAGRAEAGTAPSRWSGKRKLALVLAAVGVAAGGTGIGLGLHANSLESKSDAICKTTTCGDNQAVAYNQSARHYGLAADIGFAAGGVAVVSAAALWLLGAPSSRDTVALVPTLGATHVGISFARSF